MKKNLLILSILVGSFMFCKAQNPFEVMTNNEDEVVHLEQWQQYASRPGELLVKFHDYSDIKLAVNANGKNSNRFVSPTKNLGINVVLDSFAIDTIEQLIPNFKMSKSPRVSKSYGGGDVVERDLSQWHLIKIDNSKLEIENSEFSTDVYALMDALKALPEVESVEPNYICYTLESLATRDLAEVADAAHSADATAVNGTRVSSLRNAKSTFAPNDPLYGQQWGIAACKIDSLLTAPKLDTTWRPIIAIIDTGVDIDHSDLEDNVWTNPAEQNGATGQDDDNNGFADDIHGWDFVNQTANMHDFNSHGTHCAGIAGAVTNNGIGIAGACPDALIMPVAVMQSDGTGSISTIIQGINYARQNGADVISMSIGTYAYSIALEQALAVAYQNSVLVAAAGNDGMGIKPDCLPSGFPMFPGAFTFVFGVQATFQGGGLAGFSNIDCDGPSYSDFDEEKLYNYELSAPGVGIVSTVPNGGYRSYNGTSMSTPLVAGGIASLLQRREYQTKEILFGDLINYNTEFHPVDFWTVYNGDSISPAILQMVTFEVNDTAYGDSSYYADAGERIQIYPTMRTVWGPTDSLEMWIEFQEFEDINTLQILQNHVQLGHPLSAYAKAKSTNPIDIQIASNVVDGRHIRLILCATAPNAMDTIRQNFVLSVTNGIKLHGVVMHNDTLWPNAQYLVTSNLVFPAGDTLFIMPGTTVKVYDGVQIQGSIIAIGTLDSMITFTKSDLGQGWNGIGGNSSGQTHRFSYCTFEHIAREGISYGILNNCIYINNPIRSSSLPPKLGPAGNKCAFYNNNGIPSSSGGQFCNVINNYYYLDAALYASYNNIGGCLGGKNNSLFNNGSNVNISLYGTDFIIFTPDTNYYGSAKESIIREHVYDFETPNSTVFAYLDLSNHASRPHKECHGIVWKVEVNGFDAQDEFDSIIPLGVGTHEFKVYFNRAMDTNITPMLAMGVRPPYTQTAISENASWSEDSTIWTSHITLTGRSAIDGLNRIYVANAQDNEHFEIPFENRRFNVYVASSGSMSAGFQATPGIGKVDLEWNDQEVNYDDFLGFNLYRYQYVQHLQNYHYDNDRAQYVYDTVIAPGDTIRLNNVLIQDTTYTDFDVTPGERYYYFYKILSTALTENSPSKTVSCVPHSTIPGDANGSYAVDIADVISTINFVTEQNPQPFLFDAADVNGDGTINVLDIVGIINIILYGNSKNNDTYEQQTAIYTIENDTLYINTPVSLGGLQFSIVNCSRDDIELLEAMKGFEIVNSQNADGSMTLLAYSMSGKTIPVGKTALLVMGGKELNDMVLSDPEGHNVIALKGDVVGIVDAETLPAQIMKAFPNPFASEVRLDITTGAKSKELQLVFFDMTGRQVHTTTIATPTAGRYSYIWNASNMQKGLYMATVYIDNVAAHTIKLVLK